MPEEPEKTEQAPRRQERVTRSGRIDVDLLRLRTLASVGELAGGIAHEINTPAQYSTDNTRFLSDAFATLIRLISTYRKDVLTAVTEGAVDATTFRVTEKATADADLEYLKQEIPRAIEQTIEGIAKIARIARAIKEFTAPGSKAVMPVNINSAIETTIVVAYNELKYLAEVRKELDLRVQAIECRPGEINLALLALLLSAAGALGTTSAGRGTREGKGLIQIDTRWAQEAVEVRIGVSAPWSLDPEVPGFTRAAAVSARPNLDLARSIVVERHRGTIEVESKTEQGTTVLLRLPARMPDEMNEGCA